MKKKLTKERTLELCLELWTWLRDNPMGRRKEGWPGWTKHQAYLNCFACEYAHQQDCDVFVCRLCPLLSLWTKKKEINNYPCEYSSTSPYKKWRNAGSDKMRAKQAGKIVDFCRKELSREDV
mgnify:CR=1 FL=1